MGECLFCPAVGVTAPAEPPLPVPSVPPVMAPAAPPPPIPSLPTAAFAAPSPPEARVPDADERAHGLLLFEAEEALARGAPEKALVAASRAVKQRPDNLTARALVERARRELLKGKKRERLEARVAEARTLTQDGNFDGAERIVVSALKLIPDHPVALELFALLKERRLSLDTPEAQAERELDRLARAQAARALDLARRHRAAGQEARALLSVRHGLRNAPDDPDLLALLRELQATIDTQQTEATRRRALHSQLRDGLELQAQGQLDAALQMLRGVLREDPENARARRAILDVETAMLRRGPAPPPAVDPVTTTPRPPAAPRETVPERSAPPEAPRPRAAPRETPRAPDPLRQTPAPALASAPAVPAPRPPARPSGSLRDPAEVRSTIPPEVLLPRRRATTPWGLILGCGAALVAGLLYVTLRTGEQPARLAPRVVAPTRAASATPVPVPGPLQDKAPALRQAIENVLAAYAGALEARDAAALARARPDLSEATRTQLLEPFLGAVNATSDLRILEVAVTGSQAVVTVLRTDVIVGGQARARPPVEETLKLVQESGSWVLASP